MCCVVVRSTRVHLRHERHTSSTPSPAAEMRARARPSSEQGRRPSALVESESAQAIARRYHRHHRLGAGPTILSTVSVSSGASDVEFVQAALRGDLEALQSLLPYVSSVNARVRPKTGNGLIGRPATALHLASAAGALDVATLLLDNGADPSSRLEWLRALTPLHVATTVAMARCLIEAGAQPVAFDPREPDPEWYQRQYGRHEVADEIARAKAASRAMAHLALSQPAVVALSTSNGDSPTGRISSAAKRVVPSLTAADMPLVREAWGLTPRAAGNVTIGRSAGTVSEVFECAVCMGAIDLNPREQDGARDQGIHSLVLLPCGSDGETPHLYHADCLQRWLLRQASCPVCRQDIRPMLRNATAASPEPHHAAQTVTDTRNTIGTPYGSRPQSRKQQIRQQERQRQKQQELLFLHGHASHPAPFPPSPRVARSHPLNAMPSPSSSASITKQYYTRAEATSATGSSCTISTLAERLSQGLSTTRSVNPMPLVLVSNKRAQEALAVQKKPSSTRVQSAPTSVSHAHAHGYLGKSPLMVRKHAAVREWQKALAIDD